MPLADDIANARAAGKADEDIVAYLMRQGVLKPEEVSAAEKAGKSATQVLEYVAPARGMEHGLPGPTGSDIARGVVNSVAGPVKATGSGLAYKGNQIAAGVEQMFRTDPAALERLAQERAKAEAAFAPIKAKHPIATDIGEAVPAAAAFAAGAATPLGFLGGLAAGAVPGLVQYGTPEQRIKAAAVDTAGNLVGGAVGGIGARFLKPGGAAVGISKETADAAKRLGYETTVGQRTGNPALLNLEERLRRAVGSSDLFQVGDEARQAALNRGVNKAMGQSGDVLNANAFSTAKTALQGELDRLQGLAKPAFGQDFMAALNDLERANIALKNYRNPKVDKLVSKSAELAAYDDLTGPAYQKIRTKLTEQADKAYQGRGGSDLGQALKKVRSALDDAAGFSDADKAALDLVNRQWAAYKLASKKSVSAGDNINPVAVAKALSGGSDAFRTGSVSGPMVDVARIGETLKRVKGLEPTEQPNIVTWFPHMAANQAFGSAYLSWPMQHYLSSNVLNLSPSGYKAAVQALRPGGAPIAQGLLYTDD